MASLSLSFLGGYDARLGDTPIPGIKTDKARALLAYLAVENARPHRREALAGMFWAGYLESSARASLRHALSNLRQALGDERNSPAFLLVQDETVQFNPSSDYCLDAEVFRTRIEAYQPGQTALPHLEGALSLYRGAFLEGFTLKDSPEFDHWSGILREQLQRLTLSALYQLAEGYESQGDLEKACSYARRQLELEPWREEAHQQLMRLQAMMRQRSAALAQYEACRKALAQELGVEPSTVTTGLFIQIRDGKFEKATPVALKEARSLESQAILGKAQPPRHNLPVRLTSFIGREGELARIRELLSTAPLVTLTGSGGVGKTRLALAVGETLLSDFPDGIWFVELASVTDPQMVEQATGNALGLKSIGGQSIGEILLDYLRTRRALLLLDNCEHLIAACAALAHDLLQACPGVKILASSREVLRVDGEMPFHVPSLALPDSRKPLELAVLVQVEAVRLFVERARLARADFRVRTDNAAAVAQVCRRLDGIPLAIELAAARLSMLTVNQLASRLDDVFRLLTGGARTALPRQQTLRAAIDWSYQLLSGAEKQMLRRLSVFVGAFDLAAVEAVCCTDEAERVEALDLLSSLASKSMLDIEHLPKLEMRYHILETVRQYAREKLQDVGESLDLHNLHAAYFLGIAQEFDAMIHSPEAAACLRRTNADFPNMRAALEWELNGPSPEKGIRGVLGLLHYWTTGGVLREGLQWLEKAHNQVDLTRPSPEYAGLMWHLGKIHSYLQNREKALDLIRLSREIYRGLGDRLGYARVTGALATITVEREIAISYFEESTAILRDMDAERELAFYLWNWGTYESYFEDHFEASLSLLEESDRLYRKMGCYFQVGVQSDQARLYCRLGQPQRARSLILQGLTMLREVGDPWLLGGVLYQLGKIEVTKARDQADLREAEAVFLECLEISRGFDNVFPALIFAQLGRISNRLNEKSIASERLREAVSIFYKGNDLPFYKHFLEGIGTCLLEIAEVESALDNGVLSARLLGVLQALREPLEALWLDITPMEFERVTTEVQTRMNADTFQAAWAQGQGMSLEQAIKYILEVIDG